MPAPPDAPGLTLVTLREMSRSSTSVGSSVCLISRQNTGRLYRLATYISERHALPPRIRRKHPSRLTPGRIRPSEGVGSPERIGRWSRQNRAAMAGTPDARNPFLGAPAAPAWNRRLIDRPTPPAPLCCPYWAPGGRRSALSPSQQSVSARWRADRPHQAAPASAGPSLGRPACLGRVGHKWSVHR